MARKARKEPRKVIVLVLEDEKLVDIFKTTDDGMIEMLKPNSEGIVTASALFITALAPAWRQRLTRIIWMV